MRVHEMMIKVTTGNETSEKGSETIHQSMIFIKKKVSVIN